MKKLLSLLSLLTISSATMPMVVATAPYQKQETKLINNEINSLETNNLGILKRNKRNNGPYKIREKLILNWDKNNYKNSFNKIINELIKQNILNSIFETNSNNDNSIFEINHNAPNFIISVFIDDETTINLLFSADNLYLQGFSYGTTFYYFSDSTITSIDGQTSSNLQFNGNYNNLLPSSNPQITWENILDSFRVLDNYGQGRLSPNNPENKIKLLKAALFRIILVTAEALRFRSIYNLIITNIITNNQPIYWDPESYINQINIHSTVTNWQSVSNNIIDEINNIQTRFGITTQSINQQLYSLFSILPSDAISQHLLNSTVRVILGLVIRPALNCNRRRARNIDNDIKNQYCDAIKDYKEGYNLEDRKITVVKILDKNTKGGSLQAGDIYIGTTRGVYLYFKRGNEINIKKFDGLDFKITDIVLDNNGSAYIEKRNGSKVYHLNLQGWGHEEIDLNDLWQWNACSLPKPYQKKFNVKC
ncbi:ribosome-inactivating family protein [Spiroplasma endosymbiont of Asaphidion curtum]|uniref:ribosome-inactivating family protein n=1 Tax=Spiroplasma endosymbiont of Asaphidion curtum TaxID=3066281 RepID=UPI00313ADB4C